MYNKIYRNMLSLCAAALALALIIILLTCYTVFTAKEKSRLEEHAQSIAAMLNNSAAPETLLAELKREFPDYDYSLQEKEAANPDCGISHYCIFVKLTNGGKLHVSCPYSKMYSPLYTMICFVIFIGILIYFLSVRLAAALTDSVVRPFADIFAAEDTYAEILPLTRAIEFQNEEIKRQTENAQAREVELQLITDNMNEGLVIVDEKGCILSINDFALKLFKAEQYDVRHKHFSALLDNESFSTAVEKALKCSRSNALIELGESDYRIYCSPILKNNSPGGAIILLFDITSTYQSEKLRREFSANVSHELKTPLTSINGYAQIISNGLAQTDDIPEFAGKIAKESNRLMILIEDIMRLSNLDEGAPSEPDSIISVMEIVQDSVSSLQKKADARNISIQCEGADFTVTANKTQVSELIYNICDNAVKYNRDGGSVRVTLSENSVSVADTGIGIPQEYLERIFERFFRVDKSHSKKVDGTGLGLSIVKHIAKQNRIEIDVDSKLGEGSVFTIYFK